MNKEKNIDYKFLITRKDWLKVQMYARYAYENGGNEIGGMMVLSPIKYDDTDMYQMHHPVILEQEISGGNTILTAEALAVHYSKMSDKFGKNIRHLWWHSHHKMGAFWSGTDDKTIMDNKTPDFSVSLVINLFQDYKLRVQWFKPFEHEENVPLLILDKALIEPIPKYIEKECEKLCSERTVVSANPRGIRRWSPQGSGWEYCNAQQTSLPGLDPWETEVDLTEPMLPNNPLYMMLYDYLDDITGKLITGEIDYKNFRACCEGTNANLKNQGNPFRVKMFKKKALESDMYTMNTRDFITEKGGARGKDNYAV